MPPSSPSWVRDFRAPWQAGPGPGRGKGAVPSTRPCQELLAGLPTTGTLQPCPLPALSAHRHWHRQSLQSSCCCPGAMPPLYNWGTSPGLCPLLRAGMGPSSASHQPPQGFWAHQRSQGCPPSQEHCQPLSPHSPSGTGTRQSKPSQLQRAVAALCPGLSVGVGAGGGLLG